MKIWLVALLSFLVFLTIVQFVRSVYVNFSNTHQVIDNTNEAVRICGENNVAAVTTTGFGLRGLRLHKKRPVSRAFIQSSTWGITAWTALSIHTICSTPLSAINHRV